MGCSASKPAIQYEKPTTRSDGQVTHSKSEAGLEKVRLDAKDAGDTFISGRSEKAPSEKGTDSERTIEVGTESPTLGEDVSSEDILSSPSTAQEDSQKKLEGLVVGDNTQAPSSKVDPPIHAEGLQSEIPSLEYLGAPLPANEEQRYEALCGLEVLDTATQQDDQFDDITKLLCSIFHVPVAIVSLVAKDRQWFKSVQGLPVNSTERRASFCAWTLLPEHPEILVVPDALEDIRFAENPLVQNEPFIRFYAGAPLVTSTGHRLGSLCIIDRKPRELLAESCNVLINFAEIVVRELEKEQMRALEAAKLSKQASGLLRAFDTVKESILVCSSSTPDMNILFFNDAWEKVSGMERKDVMGRSLWDLFEFTSPKEVLLAKARASINAQKNFTMVLQLLLPDGSTELRFRASFRPGVSDSLDDNTPAVAIPGLMSTSREDGIEDNLYFCTLQNVTRRPSSAGSVGVVFRDSSSGDSEQPFDDIQLGPLLGQGSFGKVFRGTWNGENVAVKIVQPPMSRSRSCEASDDESDAIIAEPNIDRAVMECEIISQMDHPNVVATYKYSQIPLQYKVQLEGRQQIAMETWLVLEYCNQGTLSYAVERGKFDEGFIRHGRRSNKPYVPFIKDTAIEIASAMSYLHSKNVVHGDLCGGNVLLCSDRSNARGFVCKLADFGLARSIECDSVTTSTYGTVTHMPPELLTTGCLSKAADAFAWGVILWEMCAGERPWLDMLPMQVIYQTTVLGKVLEFPESAPPQLRQLGQKCLDDDPKQRPSFRQILLELDAM